MDGNFTGALAYADDITLLSPSMYGLKTLSKVCDEYATEFGVTFNFGQLSYTVKCKLINQYTPPCGTYRDRRTHCHVITAVSNQIPLFLNLN